MRRGYILTTKEASEIFLILSTARIKLRGKVQTSADKYFKEFAEGLGISPDGEVLL